MPRLDLLTRAIAPVPRVSTPLLLCAAVACGRATPGAEPQPIARAVAALRRATVGDGRFERVAERTEVRRGPPARRTVRATSPTTNSREPAPLPFDTTEWPTRVIRFTSTEAASVTLWVGDTLVVDAPTPPEGTPSTIARDLRWSSEGTDVATVSPRGVVTARTAGTARIVAWRRVGETITPVVVRPAIRGRVVTADDAPVRSRVVARAGAWADTTWTDADGRFVFRPPPDRSIDGPASVLVEPDGETHTPALLADTPVERLADVDVVLLPKRLRLTTGSYAGETIAIRPSVAQGRAREALRLWHITHPNRRGVVDDGQPVGWEPARLPLPLAFDHRGVGAVISSYDSASFWAIARQLERDWGAPLFRPATLAPNDSEFAGITVAVEPRLRSEGLTTTGWNGDGDVYDAVVAVRTRALLADPNVVTHELMHALGVGHAQGGLSSVMHPVADASSPGRATPDDVAYGRLLYAVRARSRPGRTVVGVAGAAAVDRAP